jgi:hypothetical protein
MNTFKTFKREDIDEFLKRVPDVPPLAGDELSD